MRPAAPRASLHIPRFSLLLLLLVLGALLPAALHPTPARANTIQVTTLADEDNTNPAACSLREAIQAANDVTPVGGCPAGSDGADTITFAPGVTGTIALTATLPGIRDAITIQGPGATSLTIDGGGTVQLLRVNPGARLALTGLTLTHGFSGGGGAIYNTGGILAITSSTLSDNRAGYAGQGGAIYNEGGTVAIATSTLSGNHIVGLAGTGGAIYNQVGSLVITSSTFSDNQVAGAGSDGGAIYNEGGTVAITNSTLSGNQASSGGAIGAIGSTSRIDIRSSTIAANQSSTVPVLAIDGGTAGLRNVLLANPSPACRGAITDLGGNIASDATCPVTTSSSENNTDPLLGPLADNGGPTQTMALQPDSPAIDAAAACPPPATDQRGEPRTAPCDSGAFETEAAPILSLSPTSGPAAGGTLVTITGQGFVPGQTSVSFGPSPATGVDCPSSTVCQAVSPPGTGTVTVVVTVAGQTSRSLVAGSFTYAASPPPPPPPQPMTLVVQVWRQIPPLVSENQFEGTIIPVVDGVVAADPPAPGCGRPGRALSFRVNGAAAFSDPLRFQSGGQAAVTLILPGPMPPPRRW